MNDMPFGPSRVLRPLQGPAAAPSRGPAPLQGPAASLQAPSRVPP
jgi:hypothetical protein